MRLYLAGVIHKDPLGRDAILDWLKEIEEITLPDFVAVEWSEAVFELLRAERPCLYSQLKEPHPQAEVEVIQSLANSLAYEGDAYTAVFPDADVIWLDDGRVCFNKGHQLTDEEIARIILGGVKRDYEGWLLERYSAPSSEIFQPPQDFLRQKRRELWDSYTNDKPSNPTEEDLERDTKFADLILSREQENGWGVVVTGAIHTKDEQGRMGYLLRQAGQDCNINILSPSNKTT